MHWGVCGRLLYMTLLNVSDNSSEKCTSLAVQLGYYIKKYMNSCKLLLILSLLPCPRVTLFFARTYARGPRWYLKIFKYILSWSWAFELMGKIWLCELYYSMSSSGGLAASRNVLPESLTWNYPQLDPSWPENAVEKLSLSLFQSYCLPASWNNPIPF